MTCRFEDRQAGVALSLHGALARLTACRAEEVAGVFAGIEAARRAGHWVAVLADYELGEWLLPETQRAPAFATAARQPRAEDDATRPRLTALVFEHVSHETPWTQGEPASVVSITPQIERDDYLAAVTHIRGLIERGELYQMNYTFPLKVHTAGGAEAVYRTLANRHPSAHAAFIEDAGRSVLSFSPELFLRRDGNRVTTRPMKGTAPRFEDPTLDQASGEQLQANTKDRAENLMIVDLLRNDLGQLAAPGDVRVDALLTLEKYPSVWTLTSTISADLPTTSFEAVMRALFPCGSITGAPKVAAMQHIRTLESAPRGLYCGAIGWLAPNGNFSLNVGIRTLILDDDGVGHYPVGGGIVYDSSPELEWQECLWKARVLTS